MARVLLDFWTYGCINCVHALTQLRRLEQRHEPKLAIVGVRSGKFYAERSTENVRWAVLRLEVDHPVVNDRQFSMLSHSVSTS